jgi:glutaredoxin/glutathione-dependent peroxiredoxin
MTIKVGDRIPSAQVVEAADSGPSPLSTDDLFKGKKVAIFGVPGAFTPTCSAKHLPGFIQKAGDLKAKGIDDIVCIAVNDAFVMGAWGADQSTAGKVRMVGDGDANFAKAAGLELDLNGKGLGLRCKRFSMVVEDGVVKDLQIDESGFEKTSAEHMLSQL